MAADTLVSVTLASHTMPDFATPLIGGYVATCALLMLVVSAVGVRLVVRPFAKGQLVGMLTAVLTGTALSVAGAVIAVVFGVQTGATGFFLSGGIALCMCAYVGYRVAHHYAPPLPDRGRADWRPRQAAANATEAENFNPFAPPTAEAAQTRLRPRTLQQILHPPVQPTRIHRLFRAAPGELPHWVCSDSVGRLSLISVGPAVVAAVGVGLSTLALFWIGEFAWLIVIASVWMALKMVAEGGRTNQLERRSRQRLRQQQCLQCGERMADSEEGRVCQRCIATQS